MKDYEVVYIFDSSLDEARVNEKLDRFHGLLTGDNGGQVSAVDHWGQRQFAYPIDNRTNGYYVVTHLSAATESLPEFERVLKLDDELLRYLVVINEGHLATTPAFEAPQRSEDDDQDGEEG